MKLIRKNFSYTKSAAIGAGIGGAFMGGLSRGNRKAMIIGAGVGAALGAGSRFLDNVQKTAIEILETKILPDTYKVLESIMNDSQLKKIDIDSGREASRLVAYLLAPKEIYFKSGIGALIDIKSKSLVVNGEELKDSKLEDYLLPIINIGNPEGAISYHIYYDPISKSWFRSSEEPTRRLSLEKLTNLPKDLSNLIFEVIDKNNKVDNIEGWEELVGIGPFLEKYAKRLVQLIQQKLK